MYNTMLSPQLCSLPPHQQYCNIYDPQQHIRSNRFYPNFQGLPYASYEYFHMKDRDVPPIRYQFYNNQTHLGQNQRALSTNWKSNDNRRQGSGFYNAQQHTPRQIAPQPVRRGYWINKNFKREQKCQDSEKTGIENGYNSDSGFSSRSPTPNKPDEVNSEENSTKSDDLVNKKNSIATPVQPSPGNQISSHSFSAAFQHQVPRVPTQYYNGQHYNNYHHNNHHHRNYQQNNVRCIKVVPLNTQNLEQQHQYPARCNNGKFSENKRHNYRHNGYHYRNLQPEDKSPPPMLLSDEKWNKLSQGIWDKFVECQQKNETYRKKMGLWRQLKNFIATSFPRYRLYVVGSTVSGFGSNNSDIDLCLLVRHSEMDQRNEAVSHLEQLLRCLQHCDFVEETKLIQAKVPILRFRDSQGFDVDLNCNNSVGIRNTHLLHCYSQLDWRVRPLVLVTKLWAQKHNINDAKSMTISSYSLVLMVIHFLQCGSSPHLLPCLHHIYQEKFSSQSDVQSIDIHESIEFAASKNEQTLGELFLEFLRYYVEFDYSLYAISVRLGRKIPIEECRVARSLKNDPSQWKYLCIEEPFDLTNTARSVYDRAAFENIKSVFAKSYYRLNETRDIGSVFINLEDE